MIINVFNDISAWFFRVKENISLKEFIGPFLAGIGVGFLLFLLLYILFIFVSFRKKQKESVGYVEIDNEKIKRIILNSKNRFNEESSMKPVSQKFSELGEISWEMIQDIASVYYPKSKYPMYELSSEEFLQLAHYITNRVDMLLSGRILQKMKKYKLSSIFSLLDAKKKYDETKIAKLAKKANATGVGKVLSVIIHTVNPFHWLKRAMIDLPFIKISNKVALVIIDIISEETVKVYSKSVFKKEEDYDFMKTVKEAEEFLEKNEYQEEE